MSVFSERLAYAMKVRGLTQAELVALTGVSKSAISQYLDGRFKPKRDRAVKLAGALGVDAAWLLGFSEQMLPKGGSELTLSEDERHLIILYRSSPEIRQRIGRMIRPAPDTAFRAAKTGDGKTPPEHIELDEARIARLIGAPETDEDL